MEAPLRRALLAVALLGANHALAYDIVGPNKCTNCHDHEIQKTWAEKTEGPKGHLNAIEQLEDKRSAGWGKAVGLADVYDLKGSCVKCHATVFKGAAQTGVSCETCHGPGSGFLEPHQQKGSYQKAVGLGMYDTRVGSGGSYAVFAKMCLACHVMNDKKLVAAGHPPGAGFDLGVKAFGPVVHWKESIDKAQLVAAGKGFLSGKPVLEPAPKEPQKEPAKEPAKAPEPTKAPAKTAPAKEAKAPAPTAPAPKEATVAPPAKQPGGKPEPPLEKPTQAAMPVPPKAAPTESVAPPPVPVPVPLPTLATPPEPPTGGPLSAAAAARGRVLRTLAEAIRQGKTVPLGPIPTPAPYDGPDAELLRLQDEVLQLSREALASPPKEKKP